LLDLWEKVWQERETILTPMVVSISIRDLDILRIVDYGEGSCYSGWAGVPEDVPQRARKAI
jgi:hypothetical protein